MGQQQLLLIVLGVIIVGVAMATGINMFQTSAVDSNRQALIADCLAYGAKAQRFYRTPESLAGGGQDFNGFFLTSAEASNANGDFNSTTTAPSGTAAVTAEADTISTNAATIYIEASGKENGNNGSTPVKVYVAITGSAITSTILNRP
ncbi:MAG: hypothetical protein ACE5I1_27510 [bacterium]